MFVEIVTACTYQELFEEIVHLLEQCYGTVHMGTLVNWRNHAKAPHEHDYQRFTYVRHEVIQLGHSGTERPSGTSYIVHFFVVTPPIQTLVVLSMP